MIRDQIEQLLADAKGRLAVSAFTFYVRDPCWTETLLLFSMPGVEIREAVYGLPSALKFERALLPKKEEELFFPDAMGDRLRRGIDQRVQTLIEKNRERNQIFGDFVVRENVVSRAWFLHWQGDAVNAALSVNYRQRREWNVSEMAALRRLFKEELIPLLPAIDRELRQEVGQSVPHLVNILEQTWNMTTSASRARDPKGSITAILQMAAQAFGIHHNEGCGTFHLLQSDDKTLKLEAHFGNLRTTVTDEHHIDEGQGVISWVALRRQPVLINRLWVSKFSNIHVECMDGSQSELAIPVFEGDELVGVLNLECVRPDTFSWNSVGFLAHAATQAATIYRLAKQATVAEENETVAKEILRICSEAPLRAFQSPNLRRLDDVAQIACKYLKVYACDMWRYDAANDPAFICEGATYNVTISPRRSPRPKGWSEYIYRNQQPVWMHSVDHTSGQYDILVFDDTTEEWTCPSSDRSPPESYNPLLPDLCVGSELGLPIRIGQACLGVVWFKRTERELSRPSLDSLLCSARGFAGEAALVLSCLREQELSRLEAVSLLDTVMKVCVNIVSSHDSDELMNNITQWVAEALRVEVCTLFLRDDVNPNWLKLRAAHGYPPTMIGERTHRLGQGITGRIVAEKLTVRLNTPDAVRGFPGWEGRLDAKRRGSCCSLLGIPVFLPDEMAVGTLKVENKLPTHKNGIGAFSIYDELVLTTICSVLAFRLKKEELQRENWRAENIATYFHTFRNPLYMVRLFCEGIRRTLNGPHDPTSVREDIRTIYTNAKRFQQLVNNSAFWTKRDGSPKLTETDLDAVVREIVEGFQDYAAQKATTITYKGPGQGNRLVQSNAELVDYIVGNLLQNAVEYGGGEVEVSLNFSDTGYDLRVADNGPGVSEEEKSHIGQPYKRGQVSKDRNIDGLGLGLTVCAKAIHQLEGTVTFSQNAPTGLIVTICFAETCVF